MPYSKQTNINQTILTTFKRAQSELWAPNLPLNKLISEPLRIIILLFSK